MVAVLTLVLGFLVGLYVSHRAIVVPLWETERGLREELRKLRGALWTANIEISNLRTWVTMQRQHQGFPADDSIDAIRWTFYGYGPETSKNHSIPHRAHSDVLYIPNPGDLLK